MIAIPPTSQNWKNKKHKKKNKKHLKYRYLYTYLPLICEIYNTIKRLGCSPKKQNAWFASRTTNQPINQPTNKGQQKKEHTYTQVWVCILNFLRIEFAINLWSFKHPIKRFFITLSLFPHPLLDLHVRNTIGCVCVCGVLQIEETTIGFVWGLSNQRERTH
jgi:hypothetical protein